MPETETTARGQQPERLAGISTTNQSRFGTIAKRRIVIQCAIVLIFTSFSLYSNSKVANIFSDMIMYEGDHYFIANKSAAQYAIVNFVDSTNSMDQIYGVYSIQQQMIKHNIGAAHIVIVPNALKKSLRDAIALWIGEENLRMVNKSIILDRMARPSSSHLWINVFNKLWAHNLTEFDKVIVLDTDVLVRSDISHWFDYPTPCAIQAQDSLDWNSGAMVITPDTQIFEGMLSHLPTLKRYDAKAQKAYDTDPMTSGYGQQSFLTAFYLGLQKNATARKKRCVMPTESAVLSSSLRQPIFSYFNNFHTWMYETVHLTVDKPWRKGTKPDHPFVCSMLREWNESMRGVEKYYDIIPPLQNDYLQNCGAIAQEKSTDHDAIAQQNSTDHHSVSSSRGDGEQCTFCEGGILQPDLIVPHTNGNTCRSIKMLANGDVMSDICAILQKEEMMCCPENATIQVLKKISAPPSLPDIQSEN